MSSARPGRASGGWWAMVLTLGTGVLLFVPDLALAQPRAFFTFESKDAPDVSGHGTVSEVNGAVFSADGGYEGGAFVFDGDDYIRVWLDLSAKVHIRPNVTIGAWVKVTGLPNGRHAVLSHDNGGWDRAIVADDRASDDGTILWSVFRAGSTLLHDATPAVVSDDWVFLAAVYDKVHSGSGTVTFYVDGEVFTDGAGRSGGYDYFQIGRNPGFGNGFIGWIDNVFVFDGTLTPEQIGAIRDGGSAVIMTTVADDSEVARFEHNAFSPDPPLETQLMRAAVSDAAGAHTWSYTDVEPRRDWMDPDVFDDSDWATGQVGFGISSTDPWERDVVQTEWKGEGLWLRGHVELSAEDVASVDGVPLALWGRWAYSAMDVYVNAVLAVTDAPNAGFYHRFVQITPAASTAFRVGDNVIAVRLYETTSPFFDLGLVRNPFDGMPASGFHTIPQAAEFLTAARKMVAESLIPTLSFAVMHADDIVANYTIGYLDKHQTIPATRDTFFRLASMSKPPARAAIHRLIEMGTLHPDGSGELITLDSPFWSLMNSLGVEVAPGLEPDPRLDEVTLRRMIGHTAGTPGYDYDMVEQIFGVDYGSLEMARVLYGTPLLNDPCDGTEWTEFCAPEPPDPDPNCYSYSNRAYFLQRYLVDFLVQELGYDDYLDFLEEEVVQAAASGADPFRLAHQRLEDFHERETWYRTRGWPEDIRGLLLDEVFSQSSTAEAYCHLMQKRRLFWGQPMPDSVGCHTGYPAKGGSMSGTSTLGAQRLVGDDFAAFAILTNERHSAPDTGSRWEIFKNIIESIDDEGWCPADLDGDGQTDLADFALFTGCMSGPGQPTESGCEPADMDGDGDVDMVDFGLFQDAFGCP